MAFNKKKITLAITIPGVLIGAFFLSNLLAAQKTLPPERPKKEKQNYVRVTKTQYTRVPTEIEALGRVISAQQINLISEVSGKLERGQVPLKEGTQFVKGQLLAKVNDNERLFNLKSRRSNFVNLMAGALPSIRFDYVKDTARWQSFFRSIDINKDLPELPVSEDPRLDIFLSTQNILTEYYAVKAEEANLKKFKLLAPYDGSVVTVNTEIGSVVNNGTNIATLIRTDQLELKVPILKDDIDFVKVGTKVTVEDEERGLSWEGVINRKANFIDPDNQSVNVYISLNGARQQLYNGLYLKATIPGRDLEDVMPIDRALLRNENEVFIVQDSILVSKKINVLKSGGDQAIINGLEPQDLLVVEAPTNAFENMKVSIIN